MFTALGTGATVTQLGLADFCTLAGSNGSITIQLMGVYNLNTAAGSNDYLFV